MPQTRRDSGGTKKDHHSDTKSATEQFLRKNDISKHLTWAYLIYQLTKGKFGLNPIRNTGTATDREDNPGTVKQFANFKRTYPADLPNHYNINHFRSHALPSATLALKFHKEGKHPPEPPSERLAPNYPKSFAPSLPVPSNETAGVNLSVDSSQESFFGPSVQNNQSASGSSSQDQSTGSDSSCSAESPPKTSKRSRSRFEAPKRTASANKKPPPKAAEQLPKEITTTSMSGPSVKVFIDGNRLVGNAFAFGYTDCMNDRTYCRRSVTCVNFPNVASDGKVLRHDTDASITLQFEAPSWIKEPLSLVGLQIKNGGVKVFGDHHDPVIVHMGKAAQNKRDISGTVFIELRLEFSEDQDFSSACFECLHEEGMVVFVSFSKGDPKRNEMPVHPQLGSSGRSAHFVVEPTSYSDIYPTAHHLRNSPFRNPPADPYGTTPHAQSSYYQQMPGKESVLYHHGASRAPHSTPPRPAYRHDTVGSPGIPPYAAPMATSPYQHHQQPTSPYIHSPHTTQRQPMPLVEAPPEFIQHTAPAPPTFNQHHAPARLPQYHHNRRNQAQQAYDDASTRTWPTRTRSGTRKKRQADVRFETVTSNDDRYDALVDSMNNSTIDEQDINSDSNDDIE